MSHHLVPSPRRGVATFVHGPVGRGKHGALRAVVEIDGEADPLDCVVKLDAELTMPPSEHLREWLAAAIGCRLGIFVPEPIEVTFDSNVGGSGDEPAWRKALRKGTGPVFGSCVVVGAEPVRANEPLPVALRSGAAELLAFDVFIHNSDRRAVNPNTFVSRSRVVAFDHGDAFAFLLPLLGGADPITSPLIEEVVRPHVFAHAFGPGSGVTLRRFHDALVDLDDAFFDALRQATPPAWTDRMATGMLDRACGVIQQRRDAVEQWLPQVETWIQK